MRKLVSILVSLSLLFIVAATPVSADTRCKGMPGIQVWQDSNKGGPSMLICRQLYGPWLTYPDLSKYTVNLNWGANWNDRISSYQTFNFTGHTVRFYSDVNYGSASTGGRIVETSGNDYVPNMKELWGQQLPFGYNDKVSSIKYVK